MSSQFRAKSGPSGQMREFNQSGNIAILFAIMLFPLMLAVGAAVDFSMRSKNQLALQEATDSAVLGAASATAKPRSVLVFITDGMTNDAVKPLIGQIKPMLQACASPGQYYEADFGPSIKKAFEDLGESILNDSEIFLRR